MQAFEALGISEKTLAALEKKGFKTPSPIQEKAIPLLLNTDKDVIGQAQTGTGKTAAFGIPIIERIDLSNNEVQALVLTPTRELAMQVCEEIGSLADDRKLENASLLWRRFHRKTNVGFRKRRPYCSRYAG
ncbi:MAG: DEAD/DEAH box helicase [Chitinophagales bacterium]